MTPDTDGAARRIGDAVRSWLDALDPGQRVAAVYAFDASERFVWEYTPGPREGLPLADMTNAQRAAALTILDTSLSDRGAREVRAVIALEPILGDLERRAGRSNWMRRDPDRYWLAVFGEPGGGEPWSWRIGGHHVAIHLTCVDGRVVASAPSFLGANPATVPDGPFAGRRAIDGEEALARALLASLSPDQRTAAVVDPVAPPDIFSGHGRLADLHEVPHGIAYEVLEHAQRDRLEALIRHYLDRAGPDIADAEWARVRAAGLATVTFAWAGPEAPGRGHYYAIRGPRLLIEYDNTQNDANHIHAVWRDSTNDWGEDLLAAHYRASHRAG